MRRGIDALSKTTIMEDATMENAKSEKKNQASATAIDPKLPEEDTSQKSRSSKTGLNSTRKRNAHSVSEAYRTTRSIVIDVENELAECFYTT